VPRTLEIRMYPPIDYCGLASSVTSELTRSLKSTSKYCPPLAIFGDLCELLCCQNQPLFIRTLPHESELKFHYLVHTSLDVVEEKVTS